MSYLNILCVKLQSLHKTLLHQILQIAAESLVVFLMVNSLKITIYVMCYSKLNSAVCCLFPIASDKLCC